MLIAMTDARVVVVKLAERVVDLENDDVFHARSEARRRALAEETLATFVPLASRLGVWSLKARLEDACFARLKPRAHAELALPHLACAAWIWHVLAATMPWLDSPTDSALVS